MAALLLDPVLHEGVTVPPGFHLRLDGGFSEKGTKGTARMFLEIEPYMFERVSDYCVYTQEGDSFGSCAVVRVCLASEIDYPLTKLYRRLYFNEETGVVSVSKLTLVEEPAIKFVEEKCSD